MRKQITFSCKTTLWCTKCMGNFGRWTDLIHEWMKFFYHANLNATEHCIFSLVTLHGLALMYALSFLCFPHSVFALPFFLCILVVSFRVWFQHVIACVNFLFVMCTLVHVCISL